MAFLFPLLFLTAGSWQRDKCRGWAGFPDEAAGRCGLLPIYHDFCHQPVSLICVCCFLVSDFDLSRISKSGQISFTGKKKKKKDQSFLTYLRWSTAFTVKQCFILQQCWSETVTWYETLPSLPILWKKINQEDNFKKHNWSCRLVLPSALSSFYCTKCPLYLLICHSFLAYICLWYFPNERSCIKICYLKIKDRENLLIY